MPEPAEVAEPAAPTVHAVAAEPEPAPVSEPAEVAEPAAPTVPVSYTHLTLPTILLV